MFFEYEETENYTKVMAELDDVCCFCKHFDFCPLMEAIATHIVYPACSVIQIEDCKFYMPEEDYDN